MKSRKINRVTIGNIVCALLMLAVLALQFAPYWHYGEAGEMSASIGQYVWFPTDYKDLDSHIAQQVGGDYSINQMVLTPIVLLVLSAAGAVLGLMKPGAKATAIVPTVCSLAGVWGYLTSPALKLGSTWGGHLAVCVLLLACGAVTLWWSAKDAGK